MKLTPYKVSIGLLVLGLKQLYYAQAPANLNFELTPPGVYSSPYAVSDWTVQSGANNFTWGGIGCNPQSTLGVWTLGSPEFSVVNTPVFGAPHIGFLFHSPLGGNNVVRLQNTSPSGLMTRISTLFPVSFQNHWMNFVFAAAVDGSHICCEAATVRVDFYNFALIPSLSTTLSPGSAQCSGTPGYSLSGTTSWSNWQLFQKDLTPFVGQWIRMEVTVADCAHGDHFGSAFFDADLVSPLIWFTNSGVTPTGWGGFVSFCPGSNIASIQGPPSYSSYQWIAPGNSLIPAPSGTAQTLVLNYAPTVASVYTLLASNPNNSVQLTYTIQNTMVNIAGIGASASCSVSSNGSATVVANGSGSGYSYTWLNSGNLTVGTTSVVNNLAPGIYSVVVTAAGNNLCGTATSTLAVNSKTQHVSDIFKPLCNLTPTLCGNAGNNYQWYNNTSPISGGTLQCFNVSTPSNSTVLHLTYNNTVTGCADSLTYYFIVAPAGTVFATPLNTVCTALGAGQAVVSLSPAVLSSAGPFSYSIISAGSVSPVYSYTYQSNSPGSFSLNNLFSGGQYSISANDGNCTYVSTFNFIAPYFASFTISPSQGTICSGNTQALYVNHSATSFPGQYTYSWSPSTFLSSSTTQSTLITPITALGSSTSIVYSLAVTPTTANCPLIKTITLTVVNLENPTVLPLQILCSNSPTTIILAFPQGGLFSSGTNSPIASNSGILNPALANIGINTFTYSLISGTCVSANSSTYLVNQAPVLQTTLDQTICLGEALTLTVTGANTYSWNTGGAGSSIIVIPGTNTFYSVTGINTFNNCFSTQNIQIGVDECVDLVEGKGEFSLINIYPNPSSGIFTIETLIDAEISIYNSLGQLIMNKMLLKGKQNIDLSECASGVYFVSIKNGDTTQNVRLVKKE